MTYDKVWALETAYNYFINVAQERLDNQMETLMKENIALAGYHLPEYYNIKFVAHHEIHTATFIEEDLLAAIEPEIKEIELSIHETLLDKFMLLWKEQSELKYENTQLINDIRVVLSECDTISDIQLVLPILFDSLNLSSTFHTPPNLIPEEVKEIQEEKKSSIENIRIAALTSIIFT